MRCPRARGKPARVCRGCLRSFPTKSPSEHPRAHDRPRPPQRAPTVALTDKQDDLRRGDFCLLYTSPSPRD
eukprot:12132879-Alexandrium_andersonii.AAC.1